MSVLTIGGLDVSKYIALDGYDVSVQDVDYESGRMADGNMKRKRVNVKRKIAVTFRAGLTNAQIKSIHDKVSAQSFNVTYLDPTQSGASGSGKFYVGDRSFPRHSDALGIWSSWSMDLVEM